MKLMQADVLASKSKFQGLINDLISTKANFMSELHDIEVAGNKLQACLTSE